MTVSDGAAAESSSGERDGRAYQVRVSGDPDERRNNQLSVSEPA
jgi:hypothetical protein